MEVVWIRREGADHVDVSQRTIHSFPSKVKHFQGDFEGCETFRDIPSPIDACCFHPQIWHRSSFHNMCEMEVLQTYSHSLHPWNLPARHQAFGAENTRFLVPFFPSSCFQRYPRCPPLCLVYQWPGRAYIWAPRWWRLDLRTNGLRPKGVKNKDFLYL